MMRRKMLIAGSLLWVLAAPAHAAYDDLRPNEQKVCPATLGKAMKMLKGPTTKFRTANSQVTYVLEEFTSANPKVLGVKAVSMFRATPESSSYSEMDAAAVYIRLPAGDFDSYMAAMKARTGDPYGGHFESRRKGELREMSLERFLVTGGVGQDDDIVHVRCDYETSDW